MDVGARHGALAAIGEPELATLGERVGIDMEVRRKWNV